MANFEEIGAWKRSCYFPFRPLNKLLFSQHGQTITNRAAFVTREQKLQDFQYVPWAERCEIYTASRVICTESVGANLIRNKCFFINFQSVALQLKDFCKEVCGTPRQSVGSRGFTLGLLQYKQWRKSWNHDNSKFSVLEVVMMTNFFVIGSCHDDILQCCQR